MVPRYFSTDLCGFIMPMGILYVSPALKASGKARVLTLRLNLNHRDKDYELPADIIARDRRSTSWAAAAYPGQYIEIRPLFGAVRRVAPRQNHRRQGA